jgi:DNA-binding NarL/FixJ family response regulator
MNGVNGGQVEESALVRVLLLAENWITRAALRCVLDRDKGFAVVDETSRCEEAVARTDELAPDVVVFDGEHPGSHRTVARLVPACRRHGVGMLVRAGEGVNVPAEIGGARVAWLCPGASPEEFLSAVRLTASGYLVRPTDPLADQVSGPAVGPPLDALTPRENDVLRLLARGLTNAEISAELHLGETTVKTHVQNVLNKLGARNRVTAAIYAYESGLTPPL